MSFVTACLNIVVGRASDNRDSINYNFLHRICDRMSFPLVGQK